MATFLDDVKEWSGPFIDTHQLGAMLDFDVDVKLLLSTSKDHHTMWGGGVVGVALTGCVMHRFVPCSYRTMFTLGAPPSHCTTFPPGGRVSHRAHTRMEPMGARPWIR